MKCALCNQEIKKYHPMLNHMKIDDAHEVEICSECIDKFTKWQGKVLATLFPTKLMKKMHLTKKEK